MSRTLVTGATGFVGSHVTRLLVERGDEVIATVRPRSRTETLERLGLVTPEQRPHSVLLERRSDFRIYLPPTRLEGPLG